MAISIYVNYIDKAKIAVAYSILDNAGKTLISHQMDNGSYPASIDFTNCTDDQGRTVFPSGLCDQTKKELYSIDYSFNGQSYILNVQALDKHHTLLTLTESNITRH